MKDRAITVTEAARNFADCLNRVRYRNESFVLLKNGRPLARLVPGVEKRCTGRELAAALAAVKLSAPEARAWRADLVAARKRLKPQGDKWR